MQSSSSWFVFAGLNLSAMAKQSTSPQSKDHEAGDTQSIMITDSCKKQKPNKWMSDSREKANNWITSVANRLQDRIPM